MKINRKLFDELCDIIAFAPYPFHLIDPKELSRHNEIVKLFADQGHMELYEGKWRFKEEEVRKEFKRTILKMAEDY